MSFKHTALFLASLLGAAAAQAQAYGEAGIHTLRLKVTADGEVLRAEPRMASVTLGYDLHPYLSAEAFLGTSLSSDTFSGLSANVDAKVKIDQALALLIKPRWPVNDRLEVYAKLGWSSIRVVITQTESRSTRLKDNTYGVGASYKLNERTYASITYMRLQKDDEFNASSFKLGLGYRF